MKMERAMCVDYIRAVKAQAMQAASHQQRWMAFVQQSGLQRVSVRDTMLRDSSTDNLHRKPDRFALRHCGCKCLLSESGEGVKKQKEVARRSFI